LAKPAGAAANERAASDKNAAMVERAWLVEGSKADVSLLLGRLAAFAQASNLQLAKRETKDAAQFAERAVPERRLDDAVALSPDVGPEARVVLQFRARAR
jgi:hypothetical protein